MQGSDPKALNPINLTHLMLTNQTQRITAQLYHERMLDCTHSLHDLTHDLRPLHHKQLSTSLKCCPGLVVQSAETRLRDMQTLVQQEAGVLLDRQRITIEGTPTPNPNYAYALLPLACPFCAWCSSISICATLPCMSMATKSHCLNLLNTVVEQQLALSWHVALASLSRQA